MATRPKGSRADFRKIRPDGARRETFSPIKPDRTVEYSGAGRGALLAHGRCASSTSHAPDASGSRTEVAYDDLVISRVLLAVPGERNIDVSAEARPFLESSGKVKVTPDLFVPQPNPERKKSTGVGVFYRLRGKHYCFSGFPLGQEFSRVALLKDALAQERNEPTFSLRPPCQCSAREIVKHSQCPRARRPCHVAWASRP